MTPEEEAKPKRRRLITWPEGETLEKEIKDLKNEILELLKEERVDAGRCATQGLTLSDTKADTHNSARESITTISRQEKDLQSHNISSGSRDPTFFNPTPPSKANAHTETTFIDRASLNSTTDTTFNEDCLAHIHRILSHWKEDLMSLHRKLNKVLSEIPIESEFLYTLVKLEIQKNLILQLNDYLKDYQPQEEQRSALPIAFQNIAGVDNYKEYITDLYTASKHSTTEKLKQIHMLKHEELSEDLKHFKYIQACLPYAFQEITHDFTEKWHYILARYIEKTLSSSLKNTKAWNPDAVHYVALQLGLYPTLITCWLGNLYPEVPTLYFSVAPVRPALSMH